MRPARVHILEISPIFSFPALDRRFFNELDCSEIDCNAELKLIDISNFYTSIGVDCNGIARHAKDLLDFPDRNDLVLTMDKRGALLHRRDNSIRINYEFIRQTKVRSGVCGNYVIGYPHPLHLRALIDRWHAIEPEQAPHIWAHAILRFLLLMMIHPFEDGNGRAARAVLDHEVSRLSSEASLSLGLSPFIHARMAELVKSTVESQRTESNLALFEWFRLVLKDRIAFDEWARVNGRS